MKKGIIVLLITVLAAGMVFADFSGSASVNFGVSLDEKGWGFTNKKTFDQYSFTFFFDSQSASVGEDHQTNIWAELAGSAFAAVLQDYDAGYDRVPYMKMNITTANIHVNDFTIGILGPKASFDYASSWTNDKDKVNGTPNYNYANNSNGDSANPVFAHGAGGFNVSYDGYTVSFAINNAYTGATPATKDSYAEPVLVFVKTADIPGSEDEGYDDWIASHKEATDLPSTATSRTDGKYYWWVEKTGAEDGDPASTELTVFANAESKAFELTEGMTLQAAANFLMVGENKTFVGGALKYAYEADKLSAGLASDFQFDVKGKAATLDALLNAKYDFVNAKVYFGADGLATDATAFVLEAKLGADIPVSEEIVIKLSAEVDDLLLKKEDALKNAVYSASVGTTVDKITAKLTATWNKNIDKNSKTKEEIKGLGLGASIKYAADLFTVNAGVTVGMEEKADKLSYYGVKPSASISTSTLIENCTLSLGWSGANFVADDVSEDIGTASKGSVNASAKISF